MDAVNSIRSVSLPMLEYNSFRVFFLVKLVLVYEISFNISRDIGTLLCVVQWILVLFVGHFVTRNVIRFYRKIISIYLCLSYLILIRLFKIKFNKSVNIVT